MPYTYIPSVHSNDFTLFRERQEQLAAINGKLCVIWKVASVRSLVTGTASDES